MSLAHAFEPIRILPPRADDETLQSIAIMAWKDSGGDIEAATGLMVDRLFSDKALFRKLMTPIIVSVSHTQVQNRMRLQNRQIFATRPAIENTQPAGPSPAVSQSVRAARAQGAVTALSLFDWDLNIGGTLKLADATREQIIAKAAEFMASGRTEMMRGRLLTKIADHLRPGQKVKDGLTIGDVEALRVEAQNDTH